MTILQINKYYYPKGGADVIMLEISKMLEERGNVVIPFAMEDPKNLQSPYSHLFLSNVQTERIVFSWNGLRTAGRMLFSFEAYSKIKKLINRTKPQIAHMHNIYQQISPSILLALKQSKIPVVMSVHDWSIISPDYTLFHDGKICEESLKGILPTIKNRCIKNSFIASAWAALVFYFHKLIKIYDKNINLYIAPTNFVKNKMVESGFDTRKIEVVPHFIDTNSKEPIFSGDYVAYVGRLSREKGVDVLIQAAKSIPDIKIKIAGTGPEEEKLRLMVEEFGLKNIEFIGRLDGLLLEDFYRNALCVVVPSEWYENFGRIVIEAYGAGKPVIASRVGSLAEIVKDGETGFLFETGNSVELAQKIKILNDDSVKSRAMGENAYRLAVTEYSPELFFKRLSSIYKKVLGQI